MAHPGTPAAVPTGPECRGQGLRGDQEGWGAAAESPEWEEWEHPQNHPAPTARPGRTTPPGRGRSRQPQCPGPQASVMAQLLPGIPGCLGGVLLSRAPRGHRVGRVALGRAQLQPQGTSAGLHPCSQGLTSEAAVGAQVAAHEAVIGLGEQPPTQAPWLLLCHPGRGTPQGHERPARASSGLESLSDRQWGGTGRSREGSQRDCTVPADAQGSRSTQGPPASPGPPPWPLPRPDSGSQTATVYWTGVKGRAQDCTSVKNKRTKTKGCVAPPHVLDAVFLRFSRARQSSGNASKLALRSAMPLRDKTGHQRLGSSPHHPPMPQR